MCAWSFCHTGIRDSNLFVYRQNKALELRAVEDLATVFENKFIVGLHFAIIVASPVPSCIFFDIVSDC